MANPTLVVLTDRNDLDEQLFATFSRCRDLLRQPPEQAEDRADLRRRLDREAGGVVFTTIQKFFPDQKGDRHPLLSARRNIVVVADEACPPRVVVRRRPKRCESASEESSRPTRGIRSGS